MDLRARARERDNSVSQDAEPAIPLKSFSTAENGREGQTRFDYAADFGAAIEVHRRFGAGVTRVCVRDLVGLLVNFHVRALKNGLKRIVNDFPDSARSATSAVSKEFEGLT
jgi:hypothetical protein